LLKQPARRCRRSSIFKVGANASSLALTSFAADTASSRLPRCRTPPCAFDQSEAASLTADLAAARSIPAASLLARFLAQKIDAALDRRDMEPGTVLDNEVHWSLRVLHDLGFFGGRGRGREALRFGEDGRRRCEDGLVVLPAERRLQVAEFGLNVSIS
jgi:hypothetical protein